MIRMITESVKLEKQEVDKVRQHVAATNHTIGGYISLLIKKDMDKIQKRKAVKSVSK